MEKIGYFTAVHAIRNVKQFCTPEKVQRRLEACLSSIEEASKNGKIEHFETNVPLDEAILTGKELICRGFTVYYEERFWDHQYTRNLTISWRPPPPKVSWKKKIASMFSFS